MDRRAFVSLFAAIPAVMAVKVRSTPVKPGKLRLGPVDTDDAYYDDWLAGYNKDEMHLD